MNDKKKSWPPGPWHDEPDRAEWRTEGFPCLIVRGPMGALCGYVAIPQGHPWHGRSYSSIDADVHGGLTYAAPCDEGGKICHVPQPGEPADVVWYGFDCNHYGDEAPAALASFGGMGGTYREFAYVRGEVERLARQARAAAEAQP